MQKMCWDWKCFAISAVMGFSLALALGATQNQGPQRYEISAATAEAVWVLDTATGRVWRVRQEPDSHAEVYQWFHYGGPMTKPGVSGKNEFGGEIRYERQGIAW